MKVSPAIALLAVLFLAACDRPNRSGAIINHYSQAECTPVTNGSGSPARTWDYMLRTGAGISVHVFGRAIPGGRIDVEYSTDGRDEVAANAGDYIYPADVRFDRFRGRLYVKAAGVTAAFSKPQTWLFEYDIAGRRLIQRVRVDPKVLPSECPIVH